MKKAFFLLTTYLLLFACSNSSKIVTDIVDEIKAEFVPDKRVAIFEVATTAQGGDVLLKGETNLSEAKSQLLQQLDDVGINYIDSIAQLPAANLKGKIYGVVNLSACNMRSQPKHSAELATQSTLGTPLKVYKATDNWFRVQTPDGYLGWLDAGGFTPMDKAKYNIWKLKDKVLYAKDFGFSYAAPDSSAQIVSDLIAGNILAKEGIMGNYIKVSYPDDRIAYLHQDEVVSYQDWLSQTVSAERILAVAKQHLGRPYLWGGTSGKAMDCSGFTKTVFYQNGLLLPRDASQQVHVGVELRVDTTWQNLLAGDLLFFGRKASETQKEKITHVAIYLGDGKIIHSAGTVKIESLRRSDPDFAADRFDTFVRAKRMLQNVGENGVLRLQALKAY
ncbi:MAG: C40 family peptidase [Bacteroidota bacterium]